MLKLQHFIRKYPLATVLFCIIWYLSFFTPPKTPLDNVSFIDKWVHISMYGVTCLVLWMEYAKCHTAYEWKKLAVWAFAAPIIMSGIIELLQEYCTNGRRDGDWLDLAANSTGVALAAALGIIYWHYSRPKV
jgi:hypothetical protein